ncbi:ribonuclease H-like domain-containing protein [Tanacetum coccineum]
MSANPVQHQQTKHIEIDIHFVRDMVTAGQVRVLHVPSRYQYADIFTKGLPSALFEENLLKYYVSVSSSSNSSSSYFNTSFSISSNNPFDPSSPYKQEVSLMVGRAAKFKDSRSLLSSRTLLLMGEVGDSGGDSGFVFSIVKNGIVNGIFTNKHTKKR